MDVFLIGFFWIVFSLLAGHIAAKKGRSEYLYIIFALALSPLIGLILAITASPDHEALERKAIKKGKLKKCSACAESVKPDASICKHCGHSFA